MKIPCLSLWQPWASLIGRGKSIETRGWKTDYRGPLAIHAAKRFESDQADYCAQPAFYDILGPAGMVRRRTVVIQNEIRAAIEVLDMPFGAIVAVVRLVDILSTDMIEVVGGEDNPFCIEITSEEYAFGNYSPARFAWFLDSIQILERPIPMRGQPGLFQVDLHELEVRP